LVYDSTVASNDVAVAPFVQSFDNVFAALWLAAAIVCAVALPIDLSSNVTSQPPAKSSYAIHDFFLADLAEISVPNVVYDCWHWALSVDDVHLPITPIVWLNAMLLYKSDAAFADETTCKKNEAFFLTMSTVGVVGHAVTVFSLKQTSWPKILSEFVGVTCYVVHVATLGTNATALTLLFVVIGAVSSLIWALVPTE